jgi:hypothetical protein
MQDFAPPIALAAVLAFIWGMRYLWTKRADREREMLHRERMLALEKGVPLPELPAPEGNGSAVVRYPNALPNAVLGCGLLLFFLGIGIMAALNTVRFPYPDTPENVWAFGLIPTMLGFGCLVYYWLIRRR